MLTVRKVGSIIEKLKEMLEEYMKKTEPEYYPPVENLLDLVYEHYTENNPVEKNTVAGKVAKEKEKELEEWMRGLDGMDRLEVEVESVEKPKIYFSGKVYCREKACISVRTVIGSRSALEPRGFGVCGRGRKQSKHCRAVMMNSISGSA